MRIRVHRGTREIGGTCVELEADGARILLDLGLPLDGDPDDEAVHLTDRGIPLEHAHTSGHASIPDLKRLAAAVAPKTLVPIHTFEPQQFPDHFANVTLQDDGCWWEIAA